MQTSKIAIIGAGAVGSHIAANLIARNLGGEIFLIDQNEQCEMGQVLDLRDAAVFSNSKILSGDPPDAANADIVILTAGAAQKPGETRIDLTAKNLKILRGIKKEIGKFKPSAIVILVANPVDILTFVAAKEFGLPAGQVFGSGTILDTARLRWHVAVRAEVAPKSVEGFVLGEHGNSEFPAWSSVEIAGENILNLENFSKKILEKIGESVRDEAYEIIDKKGATFFGIGACVAEICAAILNDSKTVLPISANLNGEFGISGIALSLPRIVGKNGAEKTLKIPLEEIEVEKLISSAEFLKKTLAAVN